MNLPPGAVETLLANHEGDWYGMAKFGRDGKACNPRPLQFWYHPSDAVVALL